MSYINLKKYFAIALSIFMLSGISIFCFAQQAQADAPRKAPARAVKRAPAPQHNNFVDSRYQHNRSYPARGQYFKTIPRDHRVVMHNHSRYYSSHGVWYQTIPRTICCGCPARRTVCSIFTSCLYHDLVKWNTLLLCQ